MSAPLRLIYPSDPFRSFYIIACFFYFCKRNLHFGRKNLLLAHSLRKPFYIRVYPVPAYPNSSNRLVPAVVTPRGREAVPASGYIPIPFTTLFLPSVSIVPISVDIFSITLAVIHRFAVEGRNAMRFRDSSILPTPAPALCRRKIY